MTVLKTFFCGDDDLEAITTQKGYKLTDDGSAELVQIEADVEDPNYPADSNDEIPFNYPMLWIVLPIGGGWKNASSFYFDDGYITYGSLGTSFSEYYCDHETYDPNYSFESLTQEQAAALYAS